MLYRFDAKINDDDVYEFQLYASNHSPEAKKAFLRYRLYVPALFLILLLFDILREENLYFILYQVLVYNVISLIWILAVIPILKLFVKWRIKSLLKKGKVKYSPEAVLEFYDDYLTETTKISKQELKYEGIEKIRVNDGKAIYIYYNAVTAYIIPFNAFSNNEEIESFLSFLKEKTNNLVTI